MVHNNVSLKISKDEATRVEDEAKRRLLATKKLSLVVDLDQTIIHATVDPTVAEWQKDGSNPNNEAVKDVRSFLLKDDGPGNRGCWYYVKLRPGLETFLENIAKIYELHIYTMGTRQYAKHIADIIDPDHRIFGDRILSRDESGSMTAKNLQRLFPVDTKMVVIIDDRADVWKWSPNLIKVIPYDFFVGIGDINSSFLPKRPDIQPLPKVEDKPAALPEDGADPLSEQQPSINGTSDVVDASTKDATTLVDNNASPLDTLVALGNIDNEASRSLQSTQQVETIAAQVEERPLAQMQRKLENEVAAIDSISVNHTDDSSQTNVEPERPKQNLLQDHDQELFHLETSLRAVHTAFFDAYTQNLADTQGGRLSQLRGTKKQKLAPETSALDLTPDIKTVMPNVKMKVFEDTVLVFSGMVPLGMDIGTTDLAIQAASFGARIDEDITKHTTHLVAARNRTQKVRTAIRKRKGRIKIVSPQWLYDSISSWSQRDETPYLLDTEDSKNGLVDEDEELWSESESPASANSSDTDSADERQPNGRTTKLKLKTKSPPSQPDTERTESDVEEANPEFDYDDKSPTGGTNEDWKSMMDEMNDFLASGDEDEEEAGADDDNASVQSEQSVAVRGKKRNRDDYESGDESGLAGAIDKKVQKANPATSLSQTTLVDGNDTVADAPGLEPNGEVVNETAEEAADPLVEGDGWSDFGDEDFEAELEKALSEGAGGGISPTT